MVVEVEVLAVAMGVADCASSLASLARKSVSGEPPRWGGHKSEEV